jgi:hypothetical protein
MPPLLKTCLLSVVAFALFCALAIFAALLFFTPRADSDGERPQEQSWTKPALRRAA